MMLLGSYAVTLVHVVSGVLVTLLNGADLAAMARAAGFPVTALARDADALGSAVGLLRDAPGPVFATLKIRAETLPLVLPPRDGVVLKDRFRAALLERRTAP